MAFGLDAIEQIQVRLAIEDLNNNFCYYLDHGETDCLVELFTEDAHYSHGTRLSAGREEIRHLFNQRTAGRVRTARHMMSGLRIDQTDLDTATGSSVCMTFAEDASPPVSPAIPHLVADFIDEYRCCDDGCWRISRRHIERIFVDPENPGPVGQEECQT